MAPATKIVPGRSFMIFSLCVPYVVGYYLGNARAINMSAIVARNDFMFTLRACRRT